VPVTRRLVVLVPAVAALASLLWLGFAVESAVTAVSYRDALARDGERTSARIVEEGLTRPGGAYAQAWVETPTGERAFVDLSDSRAVTVYRLGDPLVVVLPPGHAAGDVALPVDVATASPLSAYLDRAAAPALALIACAAAAWVLAGRRRPSRP
jgi:hypothetical protein